MTPKLENIDSPLYFLMVVVAVLRSSFIADVTNQPKLFRVGHFEPFPRLTTFSAVILDHFPGNFLSVRLAVGKFKRNLKGLRLWKGQYWSLLGCPMSMEQKFLTRQKFSHGLTPFFRGLPKGSHHKKMLSCYEKTFALLNFFMDNRDPTKY